MHWRRIVGLTGVLLFLSTIVASAYEMTPERKAWLAKNPYKGVTVRILTLKATVSQPLFILARKMGTGNWRKSRSNRSTSGCVPSKNFH